MIRKDSFHNFFSRVRPDYWICLLLVVATLSVYWQVKDFEFVNYDDPLYLGENPQVSSGLTCGSISWAFTAIHAANWHPLTWLSHMLDVHFYGINPGAHHLTNLLFHIANTLMVFFVLKQMTGTLWRSAVIAALFALHPLHVESVAWVAERKDVLSTFFWMLTLLFYIGYVRRPAIYKYLAVFLCFSLGLMSKPMLVTVPLIFLLLDYWPLGRFQIGPQFDVKSAQPGKPVLFLVYEKIPFFILSAASGAVTIWAQQKGGTVSSLEMIPVSDRIANALVAYVAYIGKMFWPAELAVIYPYSHDLPLWQIAGAGLIILSISLMLFKVRRRQPSFIFGWLWYLITLVPVIGLVQVGLQSMADRYTYVPIIGLFIMIVWGIPDKWFQQRFGRAGLATAGSVLLLTMVATSWMQVRYWENSITLFERANKVVHANFVIHNNLGNALARKGRLNDAFGHYTLAMRINPGKAADIHNNLGAALLVNGNIKEAIVQFRLALQIAPNHMDALKNLRKVSASHGKQSENSIQ